MMLGPLACLFLWTILHCVVEYKGVSAIRCYRCNYDVLSRNGDSSCLKNPANQADCPSDVRTCYVTTTHSQGKRDVQSVRRSCGLGDSGCIDSCSSCESDTCIIVCKDDLCNLFDDTHTNGISARGQSTEAVSMLTLTMLITFGIKLLSNYFL